MKKSTTVGLLTFVVTLAITTVIAVFYVQYAAHARRERAEFISESMAERVSAEIRRRDYITRILEMELSTHEGGITQERFQTIAEELFDDYLDIVDISLAPAGVVNYIYPLKAGLAERKNLFGDDAQGVYADYSKMSGVSVIIAPATLDDGSSGIIIRRPIYTDDEKSTDSFWGFASITINLSLFLKEVNIDGLAEAGYEYKLMGDNAITGDDRTIMEYSERPLNSPVEAMINTVGATIWTIGIEPMDNWMNLYEIIGAFIIAVIISILASLAASNYESTKANAKELEVLSYRDALTNLYNPRSYHEHMDELSKKKLPYGLIYMDLNDFKQVNDTKGHDTGDALLNIVAKRLKNSIREKDRAFRIGGDEFVVVIHGTHDKQFYEGVIDRMRQNVAREVTIGDITLQVSISAGFARYPEDGSKLEDVVKKADDAMYYNKRMMKARRAAAQERGAAAADIQKR
ncbi:MAG: sensor domain-containing diguanylate cyclase [Butyrivibrio sp.]|nr:sensor domain-containing diguanylate cyclase [Butyrivibrio sp.]